MLAKNLTEIEKHLKNRYQYKLNAYFECFRYASRHTEDKAADIGLQDSQRELFEVVEVIKPLVYRETLEQWYNETFNNFIAKYQYDNKDN